MAFAGVLNALLGHVAIENQVGVLQTHDCLEGGLQHEGASKSPAQE